MAQQVVESKSNEITAIPELLNLLDLTGAIITLDAMGTQRNIAAQIIEQKGNYILALKGNQGNLRKEVVAFFEQAQLKNWEGIDYSYSEKTEAGHHRIEHRFCVGGWSRPITRVVRGQKVERVGQCSDGKTRAPTLE